MELKAAEGEGHVFNCIASSNEPYDNGFYKEILQHIPGDVRTDGAHSLLLNHNRSLIVGAIRGVKCDGQKMDATIEVLPEAMMSNNVSVLKAVQTGALKGVSVGYDYSLADCDVTYEQKRYKDSSGQEQIEEYPTVSVRKWSLREISLTPTPADLTAQVGREAAEKFVRAIRALGEPTMPPTETDELKLEREAKESALKELKDLREKQEKDSAVAALKLMRSELRNFARTYGVELTEDEVKEIPNREKGLEIIMERKIKIEQEGNPQDSTVRVTKDASDKAMEAAQDGLLDMTGAHEKNAKDLGMRKNSVLDIGRLWLYAMGMRHVVELSRQDIASCLIGNSSNRPSRFERNNKKFGARDAANVTSGMFTSYLLANVMDKVAYNGFRTNDEAITYDQWTSQRKVNDFKTFSGAALDTGNLVQTAENEAFPELSKSEGGYSAALDMWGATISLTFQAMVNDDLGEFMRALGRAGAIAKRTVDNKVYTALAAATWTSRTTAGALTATTLDLNRASMSGITGPSGVSLGMTPRYLIVPSGLRTMALNLTKIFSGVTPTENKTNLDLIPIVTPFLADANDWYLAASQIFDALIVAMLTGMEAPAVEEFDPGAVAARKWKIMLPFKVVIPTVSSKVQGMWQGTAS
jgi:phage head maturation protease